MPASRRGQDERCLLFTVLQGYGQFSKCHVCFCGLDPGNLKCETVRKHKHHICFQDLIRSI